MGESALPSLPFGNTTSNEETVQEEISEGKAVIMLVSGGRGLLFCSK